MPRLVLLISLLLTFSVTVAGPGVAQTDEEVAAARLAYVDQDYDTALAVLRPAAEAGNPIAQNILGAAYEDGNGVEADMAVALEWYERAAEQEFDRALYNLGLVYSEGRKSVPVDYARAARYYDRAIATGYDHAMVNRGFMHEKGRGGPVDFEAAIALYERAIGYDNALAMNNLGNLLVNEPEVDEDLSRALDLFRRSAALGNLVGLNNLGAMYDNGYGVGQDSLAAMAIYQMAANGGDSRAAVNLAYQMVQGDHAFRDVVTGYAWCLYGVRTAETEKKPQLDEDCQSLRAGIDPDSIAAAEALAAEW